MPCLPGFAPVMKPVHETLEIVGMDERMGASVPARRSAASRGMTPPSISSWTSGAPTPSSPITATRGFVFCFRNRSSNPISVYGPCARVGSSRMCGAETRRQEEERS